MAVMLTHRLLLQKSRQPIINLCWSQWNTQQRLSLQILVETTGFKTNIQKMTDQVVIPMQPIRTLSVSSADAFQIKPENGEKPMINEQILIAQIKEPRNLKTLIRDYGLSAVVVHVTSSLFALGLCYVVVRLCIDPVYLATKLASFEMLSKYSESLATGGTFAVAYVIYKCAMPFRLGFTFWATPRTVAYLRHKNILKEIKK